MKYERQRSSFFNPLSYGNASLHGIRADRMSPDVKERFLRELFTKEPCPYSHYVFRLASMVYAALRPNNDNTAAGDKVESLLGGVTDAPAIEFESEQEKRLTFTLVFQTLKYQRFLQDMLEDCLFYRQYPEFEDDDGLVMIILSDYQYRKFQKRLPYKGEKTDHYIESIEEALRECKTKLNAALARSRIKARVLTIDHLLPEAVRQNDRIGSNMHVYCWYNQLKTNLTELTEALRDEGFSEVRHECKLTGRTYLKDQQCYDMLLFAHDQREFLETHSLVLDGHLVIQDKSSCVGAHSVRALINEGDDILHINVGSGLTTAHLASLAHHSETTVFAFGIHSDKQFAQATQSINRLGAKDTVQMFQENFLDTDLQDERLKHIKVILMIAECSKTGVANPVNFIVTEGEDISILKDLSRGHTDEHKLGELVVRHNSTLKHALRFPRTQAVVYCTRSAFEAENENVVTRGIEYVNMVQQKVKTPFRIAPPVLPLSDNDIESENPLCGKYLRYKPCSVMSGCFVATITREADDPKEAAKDILARAAARGIIKGVPVQELKKSKSGRKKDKSGRSKRGSKKSVPEVSIIRGKPTSAVGRLTSGTLSAPQLTLRTRHSTHTSLPVHRQTLPPPEDHHQPDKPTRVEHTRPFR